MQAALNIRVSTNNYSGAAVTASGLSKLLLTLGSISEAVAKASESVSYAERTADAKQNLPRRIPLGRALLASGEMKRAEQVFERAKVLQARLERKGSIKPNSQSGHDYCDLLLEKGRAVEVASRYEALKLDAPYDRAMSELLTGRAWSAVAIALVSHAVDGKQNTGKNNTLTDIKSAIGELGRESSKPREQSFGFGFISA